MGAIDVESGKHESEMELQELIAFEKRLRDKYDDELSGFSAVEGMCWTSVRRRLRGLGVVEDSYGNQF